MFLCTHDLCAGGAVLYQLSYQANWFRMVINIFLDLFHVRLLVVITAVCVGEHQARWQSATTAPETFTSNVLSHHSASKILFHQYEVLPLFSLPIPLFLMLDFLPLSHPNFFAFFLPL